jgi:hypothetical protein
MANRYAVANGNWSNTSTWNGGTLPASDDVVRPNGFTVVIDQDVTVSELRNNASSPAVAGGVFQLYGNYNITATTGITFILVTAAGVIQNYGTGSITINSPMNFTHNTCVYNYSTGTINLIGNILIGVQGANVIINSSTGIINLIGNLTFDTGNQANINAILNSSTGIVNVTGNITSGPGANNFGIGNSSIGTINVTGNITGGTTATAYGINNTSIGTINVTGIITARTGSGINSTTAGIINVIGTLQASTSANAVSSTSTTATNIFSGPFINSGSRNAIYCYNVRLYDDVTTRYVIGVSGSNDTITLFSPDQVTGIPSGSDVRVGTIYGPGSELTGSMAVPQPNSVSVGVAVDGTVGSALVKPEDLWNYAVTSLTASNSIGQRLANASTSASTAAITNAFG